MFKGFEICIFLVKIYRLYVGRANNFLVSKAMHRGYNVADGGFLMGLNHEVNAGKDRLAADDSESLWFLANTRPRLESVALQNLQQQGFDAYLPFYKRLKKSDAGMDAIFEPMFPRYVFFRTSHPAQSIAPVRSTRGIAQVVSFGHEVATIRADTLDAIRQLEHERNVADVGELSSFNPGHVVRFRNTALSGLEGMVKSVSSYRVAVLLEFMGRQQLVSVAHHQLEVA